MSTKIYIKVLKTPGHYEARLGSPVGEVLCPSTRTPLLDGCRVLASHGLTGPVELWDSERPYPRMRADIAKAAKLTVKEGSGRLEYARYEPDLRFQKAVSRCPVAPPDALQ